MAIDYLAPDFDGADLRIGIVQARFNEWAGRAHADTGLLSRGRQRPSGAGPADGGALGEARGGSDTGRPRFDVSVPANGYRWWYVDALSGDGLCSLREAIPTRWPAKVAELRSLLQRHPGIDLAAFLVESGLDLDDVYDGGKT